MIEVIRSGESFGLKLTLIRSNPTFVGNNSHNNAARIVLSRPPENITDT